MALILTDVGAQQILKKYFKNQSASGGNDLTLKLFVNDVAVSDSTNTGALTEASGGDYTPQVLTTSDGVVSLVGGIAQIEYTQQQFSFTGPLDANAAIYGYYIVDSDNNLIFVEKAPVSYTPMSNGDMYAITPIIQLSKGTPS